MGRVAKRSVPVSESERHDVFVSAEYIATNMDYSDSSYNADISTFNTLAISATSESVTRLT